MGTTTWWNENCIKCGNKDTVEVQDTPSSLIWVKQCTNCGWNDGKDYYEVSNNTIERLTKEELEGLMRKDPRVRKFREQFKELESAQEII
jgi:hypothetical protein